MRVLLVEGDRPEPPAFLQALTAQGHEVLRAPGVAGALESLAAPRRPEAVLVATSLPFEGAEWIAAEARRAPSVATFRLERQDARPPAGTIATLRVDVSPGATDPHEVVARRLAEVLESSALAFALLDARGRVEHGNAAFRSLVDEPEAVLSDLLVGDDGCREECLAAIALGIGRWSGEAHLATGRGDPVVCAVTVAPLASSSRPYGVVTSWGDLSVRAAREAHLRAENRRLLERSSRDHVSGLHNRAHLEEVLEREVSRARRYGHALAALMVDVDGFKRVNDEFGHLAGDAALRDVAEALRSGLRDGDVLARYGGDEFCALLPSTDAVSAAQVADRMVARVAERGYGPHGERRIGLSVGLATTDHVDGPPEDLLRLADLALLAAKRAGGGRVVAWTPAVAYPIPLRLVARPPEASAERSDAVPVAPDALG